MQIGYSPARFQEPLVPLARPSPYRARIHLTSPSDQWIVRRRYASRQIVTAIFYQMRAIKANRWIKPARTITDEPSMLALKLTIFSSINREIVVKTENK